MSLSLTFVGNATVLLRWGPFTVLTDPNFLHAGQRAHLGYGLLSERLLEPAMQVDELPPLDAVVLSHLHGGEIAQRVYLTGDTLMYEGVREIARRCPDVDLAVVHLGGTTLPGGLVVTMDGAQGAELLDVVRPRRAVPVHYDDYTVFTSPLSDFTDEVARRCLADVVQVVGRGETTTFG